MPVLWKWAQTKDQQDLSLYWQALSLKTSLQYSFLQSVKDEMMKSKKKIETFFCLCQWHFLKTVCLWLILSKSMKALFRSLPWGSQVRNFSLNPTFYREVRAKEPNKMAKTKEKGRQGNHVEHKKGGLYVKGGMNEGKECISLCTLRPKSEGKGL